MHAISAYGRMGRPGVAHGLLAWFDTTLADDIGFSNAPGEPELIYGQAFFPLAEPVHLALGDTVSVAIHADLVDTDYIWRWHTTVFSQGNPNEVKASFQQSTFWGKPLSPARLRKGAGSYVPA
jgi:type I protein arginine methyltransferase